MKGLLPFRHVPWTPNSYLSAYSTFPLDITIHLKVNMSKIELWIFHLKSTLPSASSQIATPSFQSFKPKPLGFGPGFFLSQLTFNPSGKIWWLYLQTHPDFHHLTPPPWLPSLSKPSHDHCRRPLNRSPFLHRCSLESSPYSLIPAEQLWFFKNLSQVRSLFGLKSLNSFPFHLQ